MNHKATSGKQKTLRGRPTFVLFAAGLLTNWAITTSISSQSAMSRWLRLPRLPRRAVSSTKGKSRPSFWTILDLRTRYIYSQQLLTALEIGGPDSNDLLDPGLYLFTLSIPLLSLTHYLDYGLGIGCRKSSHSRSSNFYFESLKSAFEILS